MASHKVLKSVARAVAESFTALINSWEDDFVLGHLLSAARACRRAELDVDLLSGVARPKELLVEAVRLSLPRLAGEGFSDLVKRSGSDLSFVHTARMTVRFELDAVRKHSQNSDILESP